MSREVDQRVVEMQFNNADFEKNTKKTIGLIDKLMEKLQFKGAEKGFEKLDAAAEKVDFDTMSHSLDDLQSKFSALDIIAATALVNITNKAVNAGEKLVKSLSVDQIASGWDKYTEKTSNVQTIMNATGKSIDQVNGYLNKLMWYSDETSYSFNEMTSALSQMTAAGGNIDKMIPMIMGIANATADAGKTGFAFQSTIRNLTQSYSAGHLQLQDWKSLNLMGTATKALKQELIDTAVELGKIKEGDVTIASFESSLSDKWADTQVMEKTFEKYASMMTAAYDMVQQTPGLTTSEALEKLSGQYGELAERAALAAQQATSFAQAIDSTKDAVSSSWMKVFETLFGNKEEATETWTELSERLYDIFVPSIEALNGRLKQGLNSGWQQLRDMMGDGMNAYEYTLQKMALASGELTDEQIEEAGGFDKALQKNGVSAELLIASLRRTEAELKNIQGMSDQQLDALGFDRDTVEKQVALFEQLDEKVQNGTIQLGEFSKKMGEVSGREHLVQALWNVWDGIASVMAPVKKGFDAIFKGMSGTQVYQFAEKLDTMTAKLTLSKETTDKLYRTFKGLFSVLGLGKDILLTVAEYLGKAVTAVLPLGNGILSVTAAIGDALTEFTKAAKKSKALKTVLDGLNWGINEITGAFETFSDILEKVSGNVSVVFHPLETLRNALTTFISTIAPGLYKFGKTADVTFKEFGEGAVAAFNSLDMDKVAQFLSTGLLAGVLTGLRGFLKTLKGVTGDVGDIIGSLKETLSSLGSAVDAWREGKKAETLMTIAKAVAIMAGSLTVLSLIKPERLASAIGGLTMIFGELVGSFYAIQKLIGTVKAGKLNGIALAMVSVSAAVLILSSAVKKLGGLDMASLANGLIGVGALLAELVGAATLLSNGTERFTKGALGMIAFAEAINILANAVGKLGNLKTEELIKGLAGVGVLLAEITAFSKFATLGDIGIRTGAGMVLLASSLLILQKAVAGFGGMKWDEIGKGLITVGGGLAEFAAFGFGASFSKHIISSAVAVGILSGSMNLLSSAMATMGALDWESIGKALAAMGGALTEFTIALNLTKGTLGAAASLTLMAAAINLLVPALTGLGSLSLAEIGKGLLAIAGAFAVVGAAAMILTPVTPVIVALSVAMGALAAGLGALMAMASASQFIGNLASSLSMLNGLNFQVALNGLKSLAWLLVEFVAGIFKGLAAIAESLVTSIATIIKSICDAIVLAAPSIGNAISTLIVTLCGVIQQTAPTIADTAVVVIEAIASALCTLLGDLFTKLSPGLEKFWNDIVVWITSKWEALKSLIAGFFGPIGEFFAGLPGWASNVGKAGGELVDSWNSVWSDSTSAEDASVAGEQVAEGYANGIENGKKSVTDRIAEVAQAAANAWNTFWGIASPSKEAAESGDYIGQGYANGICGSLGGVEAAMLGLADGVHSVFTDYWQIHSPSKTAEEDAGYIPDGFRRALEDSQKQQELEDASYAMAKKLEEGASKGLDEAATTVSEKVNHIYGLLGGEKWDSAQAGQNVKNGLSKLAGGITGNGVLPGVNAQGSSWADGADFLKQAQDTVTAAADAAGGKTKGGSKAKGKTAAEQMAEEYSKKLKANKYLQDALTKETALWELQSEDSVTNEELLAKRTEVVTQQIELQADRVAIAQEQYDKLLARAGKDNDKTKDAYATLLDEQASLEKLKASRYDDIWEDVLKRYENDSKTAEDEYNLWASLYEDTASVTEAANKKMEQINKKIASQAKVVTAAEEEYTQLKAEFGEQSQKTQEAYRKYLEEQKDQQDLINELEKAQLEQFDNQIARYQREAKIVQNRQQMLAKIYNDGDLSGREDAYTSAVEKYGEGSKQARQAALQGTMSSLISVGTAMTNMSSSLKQLTEYQKTYDYYVAKGEQNRDDALDALSALQSEQYNFVGFAENLADAFDMTDNGKKAMMQLGYTISKNWKPIQNGFNKVWNRVQQNFPETAKKLTATLNLAMSEGAAETASSFMQTIVAAMSGDYATAIVSGLNTVLSFMNTEFGKAVLQGLAGVFAKAMTGLSTGGFITKLLGKLFGFKGVASAVAQTAQVAAQTAQIAQSTAAVAETVAGTNGIVTQTAKLAGNGGFLAKILGFLGKAGTAAKVGLGKAVGLVGAKFAALTATGGPLAGIAAALSSTGPIGIAVAALAAGGGLVIANWSKVKQWFSNFGSWMKDKFSKLWSGAKSVVGGAVNVGKNILGGLWKGVKTVAGGLWNGIKSIGKGIINGFKSLFGIHSPSTVFAEIGQYMMLGLQNGISSNAQGVNRTLEDVSKGALGVAMDCSKRLLAATDEAMEYQPTIQPLVDLSNVQAGAAWLDENLSDGVRRVGFELDRSARLADIVSRRDEARKAALWQKDEPKTEEMSNKDIVEAIGTLGGRIDSVAEAVSRMKLSINGKKFVGGIINDVDEGLGKIASRNRR